MRSQAAAHLEGSAAGRYCLEIVAVELDEAQPVLACLDALRRPRAEVAAHSLCALLNPVQVRSARAELAGWTHG